MLAHAVELRVRRQWMPTVCARYCADHQRENKARQSVVPALRDYMMAGMG